MGIKEDLQAKVQDLAQTSWNEIPNSTAIPDETSLTFGNSGARLNVTVLYADLAGSTQMVDSIPDVMAAEYYKAFLHCASQLIRRHNGNIQAYDGDRVMGVYLGESQADDAVSTALELNFAVHEIINPVFGYKYGNNHRELKHTVGIDSGRILAIKVGVRSAGELTWVGSAANYAAKLNSFPGLDSDFPTRITESALSLIRSSTSKLGSMNEFMWDGPYNNTGKMHYRTRYMRSLPTDASMQPRIRII
ncbi:adenylate/guanylate cyclase domain-containing protein [Paraburkholderia tropica]|uniref:adenylate/guanylate cyclase domain-containing protein n=1 Tax=Paraburkholderia tropica TaxID=92647 RepID=UPI002AB75AB2|nr:adenylate/guanylate cyclase domain-containing protein [Paraburkholderia tropica]